MILLFGDTHGSLVHVVRAVNEHKPNAIILLGDIQAQKPLHEELKDIMDMTEIWWIHGNHDTDSRSDYDNLFGSELADRNLHGRVVPIDGMLVAGLGGIFREKVWFPDPHDAAPAYERYEDMEADIESDLAYHQISSAKAAGQLLTHRSSIFYEDWFSLYQKPADILVTHEAPSCHPHGFTIIDELAQSMGVKSTFHGHHHDKLDYSSAAERLGFMPHGVGLRGVCDIAGNVILSGELDAQRRNRTGM